MVQLENGVSIELKASKVALKEIFGSDDQPDPSKVRLTRQFVVRHGGEVATPNHRTVNRRDRYNRHLTVPPIDHRLKDPRVVATDFSEDTWNPKEGLKPMEKQPLSVKMRRALGRANVGTYPSTEFSHLVGAEGISRMLRTLR